MTTRSPVEIDLARVLCSVAEVQAAGARAFSIGRGDWPLRGVLVCAHGAVHAYVNRCPHAGHALDLLPGRFLTADGALLLCSSHGALFEKATGLCVAGPCAGRALTSVALQIEGGFVMLAADVDVAALADLG